MARIAAQASKRAGWILALVGLAVVGCSGHDETKPGAHTAGMAPRRGGTVTIGYSADPKNLIPYSAASQNASEALGFVFMMLANTDSTLMGYEPSLARSWEWSADHLDLTMRLRDDMQWSDGVPVTAADVTFTFEVQCDSLVNWTSRHWKLKITACDAVDAHTVRFHFKERFPDQFRYAKEGYILPQHIYQSVARDHWDETDLARTPVGCGAFRLERWEAGQRLVFVRNEHYADKVHPYVDRLVLQVIPDPSTRVAQLHAGQIDFLADMPPRDAAAVRDAGSQDLRLWSGPGRGYEYVGYNERDSLFARRAVREALTRAIDRESIIKGLCYGFAEPFESPMTPLVWAYDRSLPITPYDPAGAALLLAAAGWRDTDGDGWLDRNGKKFEFALLLDASSEARRAAAVPIQANWKAVGVKATLDLRDTEAARAAREHGLFQASLGGWGATVTPNLLPVWGCGKRLNYFGYCNPRVDSLHTAAVRLEPDAARPLWHEAQRVVTRDYPYTWLYYKHDVVGMRSRLQGVHLDARGAYESIEEWWVTDAK